MWGGIYGMCVLVGSAVSIRAVFVLLVHLVSMTIVTEKSVRFSAMLGVTVNGVSDTSGSEGVAGCDRGKPATGIRAIDVKKMASSIV